MDIVEEKLIATPVVVPPGVAAASMPDAKKPQSRLAVDFFTIKNPGVPSDDTTLSAAERRALNKADRLKAYNALTREEQQVFIDLFNEEKEAGVAWKKAHPSVAKPRVAKPRVDTAAAVATTTGFSKKDIVAIAEKVYAKHLSELKAAASSKSKSKSKKRRHDSSTEGSSSSEDDSEDDDDSDDDSDGSSVEPPPKHKSTKKAKNAVAPMEDEESV